MFSNCHLSCPWKIQLNTYVCPPCSIVEDSLIQYQIIPGFSASPLIHLAGWLSAVLDTIIPYLAWLWHSDVVNRDLSSSTDTYGIRLPMPVWSSGQVPNFFSNCIPVSPHCEVVRLKKYKNKSWATKSKLMCSLLHREGVSILCHKNLGNHKGCRQSSGAIETKRKCM